MTLAVALGLTLFANEKPTPELQDTMKSNAAANAALRMHIMAKDYDAAAMDALTLKVNFAKIESFFTAKKWQDAMDIARTGGKAAGDLAVAALAKDDAAVAAAQMALAPNCGACHMKHREQLPDKSYEIK
jgi:mono/diheme cytochrome c family protein